MRERLQVIYLRKTKYPEYIYKKKKKLLQFNNKKASNTLKQMGK